VPPLSVQFWHADPFEPHWVSEGAAMQVLPLQHPLHDCALHPEPASLPPSLPSLPELPVLPLLEPLLLPLPPLPLLLPLVLLPPDASGL
jgi:hypothetical protein